MKQILLSIVASAFMVLVSNAQDQCKYFEEMKTFIKVRSKNPAPLSENEYNKVRGLFRKAQAECSAASVKEFGDFYANFDSTFKARQRSEVRLKEQADFMDKARPTQIVLNDIVQLLKENCKSQTLVEVDWGMENTYKIYDIKIELVNGMVEYYFTWSTMTIDNKTRVKPDWFVPVTTKYKVVIYPGKRFSNMRSEDQMRRLNKYSFILRGDSASTQVLNIDELRANFPKGGTRLDILEQADAKGFLRYQKDEFYTFNYGQDESVWTRMQTLRNEFNAASSKERYKKKMEASRSKQ